MDNGNGDELISLIINVCYKMKYLFLIHVLSSHAESQHRDIFKIISRLERVIHHFTIER